MLQTTHFSKEGLRVPWGQVAPWGQAVEANEHWLNEAQIIRLGLQSAARLREEHGNGMMHVGGDGFCRPVMRPVEDVADDQCKKVQETLRYRSGCRLSLRDATALCWVAGLRVVALQEAVLPVPGEEDGRVAQARTSPQHHPSHPPRHTTLEPPYPHTHTFTSTPPHTPFYPLTHPPTYHPPHFADAFSSCA